MEVVKAVILKIINYSDTQKIIQTFSKEKGYCSFISPAFVFKKKDFLANYMQVAEIEYYENIKSNLHKLKSFSLLVNGSQIYYDIYKMNIALLWSEILSLLLKQEQKNEALFDFLVRSVEYLNSTEEQVANFNLFFLYRLPALIGFKINTDTYEPGSVFNINDGNFCMPENNSLYVSGPNAAKTIYTLCTCRVEDLKNIPLNQESRSILIDIILLFFSIHLSLDFNVKSIRVLREVFGK